MLESLLSYKCLILFSERMRSILKIMSSLSNLPSNFKVRVRSVLSSISLCFEFLSCLVRFHLQVVNIHPLQKAAAGFAQFWRKYDMA